MDDQELQLFLEKNKKLINSDNTKTILRRVYNKTKEIDWMILYDFLGEVLLEKSGLRSEEKKYIKFLEGYNNFISKSAKPEQVKHIIPPIEVLKREKYFLEKYCIAEGEEILCSFLGRVQDKSVNLENAKIESVSFLDRVFITNYRIIVLSYAYVNKVRTDRIFSGLLYLDLFVSITSRIMRAIKTSMAKSHTLSEHTDKVFFGYNLPFEQIGSIKLYVSKKGKNKGKVVAVKFTASTDSDFFDLLIVTAEGVYKNNEEVLLKIAKILENLEKKAKLYLMRISKETDEHGKEVIAKICGNCKEKNNFKETDNNIFNCLKCGCNNYIRED